MERSKYKRLQDLILVLVFATFWWMYRYKLMVIDKAAPDLVMLDVRKKAVKEDLKLDKMDLGCRESSPPVDHDRDVLEPWSVTKSIWKPFQRIEDKDAWIYSAYFDHVTAIDGYPQIIAFGLVNVKILGFSLTCIFTNLNDERATSVSGFIKVLPDQKEMRFRISPAYFICPLRARFHPLHVTFTFNNTTPFAADVTMPVIYPSSRKRELTVCYSVLHSDYNNAAEFITSVEFSLAMGASHIFLYNYSLGPDVDRVVGHYQNLDLVTALPWPLPLHAEDSLSYFGQMAAVHDCVYRNRNSSDFVALPDPDELLVSRTPGDTWLKLLQRLETSAKYVGSEYTPSAKAILNKGNTIKITPISRNNCTLDSNSSVAVFTFESVVFDPEANTKYWAAIDFTKAQKDFAIQHQVAPYVRLVTRKKSQSKLIVRPDKVLLLTIHHSHTIVGCSSVVLASAKQAVQHHYRKSIKGATGFNTQDKSFLRLHVSEHLLSRIIHTYKNNFQR